MLSSFSTQGQFLIDFGGVGVFDEEIWLHPVCAHKEALFDKMNDFFRWKDDKLWQGQFGGRARNQSVSWGSHSPFEIAQFIDGGSLGRWWRATKKGAKLAWYVRRIKDWYVIKLRVAEKKEMKENIGRLLIVVCILCFFLTKFLHCVLLPKHFAELSELYLDLFAERWVLFPLSYSAHSRRFRPFWLLILRYSIMNIL